MKSCIVFLAFLALAAPVCIQAGEVNPIQKVIEMLSDLEAKILKEGAEAQKAFAEFSEFCEETSANLQYDIKTGKSEVAELKATIESETASIASLDAKIEELADTITTNEADLKAATTIREKEAADFAAEEKDLLETINTIERAVGILEKELSKTAGASMLQLKSATSITQALKIMVQASVFSMADASRLTALIQSTNSDDSEQTGAPDPAVYENQSGSIIETLNSLCDKAKDELDDARKKETDSMNAYEMLKQSIEDAIKFADKDMSKAKKELAESGESKATAEGDLDVTSKSLAADIESLSDLHHECMTKASDFEESTKSRGEELKALAQAKKIIVETTSGAESLSYDFDQESPAVLLQLTSKVGLTNFAAVRFVRDLAKKQGSPALAQLATRMATAMRFGSQEGEDPFKKVKGLISEMLERLLAEGEADATHHAWCEKETGETETTKAEKKAEIDKLSAKIDGASARSAQLKEEIAELQKQLAELASTQSMMDKMRQEEHSTYLTNKPEMEKGLEGIKLALKVLNEYYGKEDKAHASAEGASSGIIGLLEVCESDFSKGLAEMVAAEETSAAEYDAQTKENEITKVTAEQDVKYKTKEAASLDKAIAEMSSDREGVQAELDAALQYLKELAEACIAKPDTYEERVARRNAELAGLKEALEILSSEAALIQSTSSRKTLRGTKKHGW